MPVTDAGNLFVQAFLAIPKTGAAVKESVDIYDAVLVIICLRGVTGNMRGGKVRGSEIQSYIQGVGELPERDRLQVG